MVWSTGGPPAKRRQAGGFMSRAGCIYLIVCAMALVAAGVFESGTARGSDYIGANGGSWSQSRNWSPSGVPVGGGIANVNVVAQERFSVYMDVRYSPGTALSLLMI